MRSSTSADPTGAASRTTSEVAGAGDRYPPAPWRLAGPAVVVMTAMPVERARAFVPDDLEIVAVAPGRTLAALVVADYQEQATFPYGELAVMPAVVRCGRTSGAWISDIWVDSDRSLRGGREMWGMYKYKATFGWTAGESNSVTITADSQRLVSLAWRPPRRLLPSPGFVLGVGSVDGDRRRFTARGLSWMAAARVDLDIPSDSPLARYGFDTLRQFALAGNINLLFGGIRLLRP